MDPPVPCQRFVHKLKKYECRRTGVTRFIERP